MDKKGSAILTTIFLMFAILSISAIGLDVILGGLAARRAQGASTRAFYAAESGLERAVTAFKIRGEEILSTVGCSGRYLNLDNVLSGAAIQCSSEEIKYDLLGSASPTYSIKIVTIEDRTIGLLARGNYQDTNRDLYVRFCLPSCAGKSAGEQDECGGTCK